MKSFVTPVGTRSLLQFIEENQDKKLVFEVRPYKKPRSQGLNAFHWSQVITPIADFMGESPEEAHRELCGSYFGWVENSLGGRKPRRTTTRNEKGERDVLDWEVMNNFIHHCQRIAAELGVPLPEQEAA